MSRFLSLITALLVILPAGASLAQSEVTAPGVTRIHWAAADAFVYADSESGVQIWITPAPHATQNGRPLESSMADGFAPDSVDEWIAFTRQLLELTGPPNPDDTTSYVSSGILRGWCGNMIAAARLRAGSGLAPGMRLLLASTDKHLMVLDLSSSDVGALLEALDRTMRISQVATAVRPATGPSVVEPRQVPTGRGPRYPTREKRSGIEGEVLVDVVIDTTGRADLSTLRIVAASTDGFEAAVRAYFPDARFVPATAAGRPIRRRVKQPFTFTLSR